MGKNRVRTSLIRAIANIITHEMIAMHTNRPESAHFINSEIIEYRSQAERTGEEYNWDKEDKEYAQEKALKMIKGKLASKYFDVKYSDKEIIKKLKDIIREIM